MKFILSEDNCGLQKKDTFLLEERFFLTEATATAVAAQWTPKFDEALEPLQKIFEKYIEYASLNDKQTKSQANVQKLKQLKTKLETALKSIANTLDLPESAHVGDNGAALKAETKELWELLLNNNKDLIDSETDDDKRRSLFAYFEEILNNLKGIAGKANPLEKADIDKLSKLTKNIETRLLPLCDVNPKEDQAVTANEENLKVFKETCEENLKLIKNIKLDLPVKWEEGQFTDEELSAYVKLLRRGIEIVQAQEAKAKIDDITKDFVVKQIRFCFNVAKSTNETLTSLNKSPLLRPGSKKDWKTKLASAVNKETVIEEFIYATWKREATEVLKIKQALLQSCEAWGFATEGEGQNPFIRFISDVYLKYQIKPELYDIIHNLVANGYLSRQDLMGNGPMERGNLVFCRALYSLDAGAIKLYIRKQYNLLKAATIPDMFSTNAEMTFNAIYKVQAPVTGNSTKNSTDMPLRSMAEIEQLEEEWTGGVSDTAVEAPKNKVVINADLLNQIDTAENAVKVLVAMGIKFSANEEITKAVESCTEAKRLMNGSTTVTEIQKLVASVERLYKLTNINATQALNLIKSILESDKFNLTRE